MHFTVPGFNFLHIIDRFLRSAPDVKEQTKKKKDGYKIEVQDVPWNPVLPLK